MATSLTGVSPFDSELPAAQPLAPLEKRIQLLESAVAALQSNQVHEKEATGRNALQGASNPGREAGNVVAGDPSTGFLSLPGALAGVPTSKPPRALASLLSKRPHVFWMLVELYREVMSIIRMFADWHYKMAWSTRAMAIVLLAAILTSQWWAYPVANIPFIGWVLVKLIDLVLVIIMYKALSREARRYLESRPIP